MTEHLRNEAALKWAKTYTGGATPTAATAATGPEVVGVNSYDKQHLFEKYLREAACFPIYASPRRGHRRDCIRPWAPSRIALDPIGVVESPLTDPGAAPKQGREGAPDGWLVFGEGVLAGLSDIRSGDELIVLTWLDRARRDVLQVDPRRSLETH